MIISQKGGPVETTAAILLGEIPGIFQGWSIITSPDPWPKGGRISPPTTTCWDQAASAWFFLLSFLLDVQFDILTHDKAHQHVQKVLVGICVYSIGGRTSVLSHAVVTRLVLFQSLYG